MADDTNRKAGSPPPADDEQNTGGANITDTPKNSDDEGMAQRVERLGGEPAPAISPEEFARLQQSGQIHIDARGRVQTTRREKTDAGMSLRKRRAWYGG